MPSYVGYVDNKLIFREGAFRPMLLQLDLYVSFTECPNKEDAKKFDLANENGDEEAPTEKLIMKSTVKPPSNH